MSRNYGGWVTADDSVVPKGGEIAGGAWNANEVYRQLGSASGGGSVPVGTKMVFYQASPPEGWTLDSSNNDKALRLVSSNGGGTGGSIGFTSAFNSKSVSVGFSGSVSSGSVSTVSTGGSVSSASISLADMASHTHTSSIYTSGPPTNANTGTRYLGNKGANTGSTGSGGTHGHGFSSGSHSHSLSSGSIQGSGSGTVNLNVQYVDVIICAKAS